MPLHPPVRHRDAVPGRLVARVADVDLVEGEQDLTVIELPLHHGPGIDVIGGGGPDCGGEQCSDRLGRVGDEHTGDCLAVLAEHADAIGVSSVG